MYREAPPRRPYLRVSRPGERDVDFRSGQLIRDRHRHRIVFLNRIEEAPLSRLLVLVPVEFQDQRLDDRLERGDPPARFVLFHLVAPVFRQVRAMADSTPLAGDLLSWCGGRWFSDFLSETLGVRMVFESPPDTVGVCSSGALLLGHGLTGRVGPSRAVTGQLSPDGRAPGARGFVACSVVVQFFERDPRSTSHRRTGCTLVPGVRFLLSRR